MATAAAGLLAVDLAQAIPPEKFLTYASKHMNCSFMPMAVMAFTGLGGSARPYRIRETIKLAKEIYAYL